MPQENMLPLLLLELLLTTLTLTSPAAASVADTYNISKAAAITKPGCPSKCGNLTVPFPFGIGIGSGCALSPGFELNCTTALGDPARALKGNVRFLDISDDRCRVGNVVARKCYNKGGEPTWANDASYNVTGTPSATPRSTSSTSSAVTTTPASTAAAPSTSTSPSPAAASRSAPAPRTSTAAPAPASEEIDSL